MKPRGERGGDRVAGSSDEDDEALEAPRSLWGEQRGFESVGEALTKMVTGSLADGVGGIGLCRRRRVLAEDNGVDS